MSSPRSPSARSRGETMFPLPLPRDDSRRHLLPGHAGPCGDLVLPVERELTLGREVLEQGGYVARIELTRVMRHRRGDARQPDDGHTFPLDDLARLRQLAVAARLGREVDDHRA